MSRYPYGIVLLGGLCGLLLGCDPRWRLHAAVKDHLGAPVEGARLVASCFPSASYATDAAGRIEVSELGTFEDHCILLISKPGYRSVTTTTEAVCTARNPMWVGGCGDLRLDVQLQPIP